MTKEKKLSAILTEEKIWLGLNEDEVRVAYPAEVSIVEVHCHQCGGNLVHVGGKHGLKFPHQCQGCGEPFLLNRTYPNTMFTKRGTEH